MGSEPLNEFSIQYLALMSFPTLFPDGKGDPTNNAIMHDTADNITEAFATKLKHLIKFGENVTLMENGFTDLPPIQGLHIGPTICCTDDES